MYVFKKPLCLAMPSAIYLFMARSNLEKERLPTFVNHLRSQPNQPRPWDGSITYP